MFAHAMKLVLVPHAATRVHALSLSFSVVLEVSGSGV